MNASTRSSFCFVIIILVSTQAFAGGGWVKDKSTGYYKLGQSWVQSQGYFSGGSNFSPGLDSDLLTTSFYMEQGLGGGVSLELYAPLYMHHSISGTYSVDSNLTRIDDAISGPGDIDIGLRFKVYQSDLLNISGTARLGLPTGTSNKGELNNLFTGDGELNQMLRLDASVPFGTDQLAGFMNIYGAFNNRKAPFDNELHYGLELGISPTSARVWLIARYIAVDSSSSESNQFSNGFAQSMSFSNYMLEAIYYTNERMGISASYTDDISGNMLLVTPNYSFGIFMDLK